MNTDMSPLGRFKRKIRELGINPRVRFVLENNEYLRVLNLRVPRTPGTALKQLISADKADNRLFSYGSSTWVMRLGKSFGLLPDGWDEEGNPCFILKLSDITG